MSERLNGAGAVFRERRAGRAQFHHGRTGIGPRIFRDGVYHNEYHTLMRVFGGQIREVREYSDTQHAHSVWLAL
jgi:hypothetical protein